MESTIIFGVSIIIATAAGFGAGWGLKPSQTEEALQAQALALEALTEGQEAILAASLEPVVLDAEIKATLAGTPVQCRTDMGGDPLSIHCQWATCLQFGQSSAQRPECSAVRDLLIRTLTQE